MHRGLDIQAGRHMVWNSSRSFENRVLQKVPVFRILHKGECSLSGIKNKLKILRPLGVLYLLFIFLFLPSCSSKKQQEWKAPPSKQATSQIEVQPLEATRESTFYISSKDIDLSSAKIAWLVNEKTVEGALASQFHPSEIKKGDKVQARVTIRDQEMTSNQVIIKNIPPIVARAKIIPSVPKANDILKIEVTGNDRDGDPVSFFYEWSRDGSSSGSGDTLEGPFKRGDKISITIRPFDGEEYGQSITLATSIFNSPPKPSEGGEGRFENDVYLYQVRAIDPDGDALTYNLKHAPKGMVIDNSKGLITWKISEKDKGRHPVTVQITDGQGGEVLYNFDVTVGSQ